MAKQPDSLIEMALITKAHGLRGEVALYSLAESDAVLLGDVIIASHDADPNQKTLHISKIRRHHQAVLATFDTITDRTLAESLRGKNYLFQSTHCLMPLKVKCFCTTCSACVFLL